MRTHNLNQEIQNWKSTRMIMKRMNQNQKMTKNQVMKKKLERKYPASALKEINNLVDRDC